MKKQLLGNSLYLGDWACKWNGELIDNPFEELKKDFKTNKLDLFTEDISEIVIAYYSYEDYNGEATVIYRDNNKLYEVSGGHCSCYGLEGQWEPEEITKEYIIHRINKGKWCSHSREINKKINEHLINTLNLKGE